MKVILLVILLLASSLASARALELSPEATALEAARMNARAGRVLNEDEVDLLHKYGCLSGTEHPVCQGKPDPRQAKAARRQPGRVGE